MTKKSLFLAVSILLAPAAALTAPAARGGDDAILLAAPSRYSVMQVAFDVARSYPTVLVSYQGEGDSLLLHVWNGTDWLPLSLSDYQSGAFLATYPRRVILLGDDQVLPAELRAVGAWCSEVSQVPALDTASLVNGIGTVLPFTPADWRWFAGRYNLSLRNLNAKVQEQARKEDWYKEKGAVKDEPPAFFKYFTRARRDRVPRAETAPPLRPVEVEPGETVNISAP